VWAGIFGFLAARFSWTFSWWMCEFVLGDGIFNIGSAYMEPQTGGNHLIATYSIESRQSGSVFLVL
jgi:hypothetical protein